MDAYEFDDDEPFVVIEKESGGVGSFLLGVAIGAGVALLLVPQSGAETRRGLSRSARNVGRVAQGAVEDAADSIAGTYHQAREQVETRIDTARQAIDLKKRQVSRAMEAGREAAQQARDDLERRIAETKAAYQTSAEIAKSKRGDL